MTPDPTAITPTTLDALWALMLGAAALIVSTGVPVILFWLRNVKAQLDAQYTELRKNTKATETVEKQTNGEFARIKNEAQKWRAMAERMNWIMREVNRTPEGRALLDTIMTNHRSVIHDSDYDKVLARLLNEERSQ